ncbi:MAG: glycosyltransferase family 2 protein [Flavipsychrobacter sp.]|nr:glycosyltransferase family 2 protein [Flavipsychrobacter sp.]
MPFFSVIIPSFNRADKLGACITSVLEQTFPDFELLIIDDGSTDNTREVVASFTDKRIIYTYQENKERSASRNKGMSLARGRYIAFLDSDDVYSAHHLQSLYGAIAASGFPVAMIKTRVNYIGKPGYNGKDFIYTGSSVESALQFVWKKGCQLNSVCVHSDIGRAIFFPEQFFWFEDIYWALLVVRKYKLIQVDIVTVDYKESDIFSLLDKNYHKYLDNCIACIRSLEQLHGAEFKKLLGKRCFDIKVSELYLGFVVKGAVKKRRILQGFTYLRKAIEVCITPKLTGKYIYYTFRLLRSYITG